MLIVAVLIILLSSCGGSDFDNFARNKSFVFISGWPQSGTSFLQQVFTLNPMISTMVENCENILGKRCINWNHEGQWLIPGKARAVLNSGVMCPHDGNITNDEERLLLSEWERFWTKDKQYFVEKSPHSFLKIPLLRKLFRTAQSVKFVILLKHPVTLNVATPKGYSWTQHSERGTAPAAMGMKKGNRPQQQTQKLELTTAEFVDRKLTVAEKNIVADFFVDMMLHNNSTVFDHRSPHCSMGWLTAMEYLHKQLILDPHSHRDVRIVRFEAFHSPLIMCKALFAFAMNMPNTDTRSNQLQIINQVCEHHFGSSVRATVSSASSRVTPRPLLLPGTTGRKSGIRFENPSDHSPRSRTAATSTTNTVPRVLRQSNNQNNHKNKEARLLRSLSISNCSHAVSEDHVMSRRALRLRTISPSTSSQSQLSATSSFHFIPELVSERGRMRVREFSELYRVVNRVLRGKIEEINKRLGRFGYDVLKWNVKPSSPSILSEWEL